MEEKEIITISSSDEEEVQNENLQEEALSEKTLQVASTSRQILAPRNVQ
jgi:hypothetical protein